MRLPLRASVIASFSRVASYCGTCESLRWIHSRDLNPAVGLGPGLFGEGSARRCRREAALRRWLSLGARKVRILNVGLFIFYESRGWCPSILRDRDRTPGKGRGHVGLACINGFYNTRVSSVRDGVGPKKMMMKVEAPTSEE